MMISQKIKICFLFSTICYLLLAISYLPPVYAQENIIPAIKFKDADIKVVLQSIAQKATREGKRVNIVTGTEVRGLVSVNLEKVDWVTALEAILKAHGYDYEWIGDNVILVETLEKLTETRKNEALAKEQEPLEIVTYRLKYLNAQDILRVIKPQLTARGRITVLEVEPQKGWIAKGGIGGEFERAERAGATKPQSNTLIITDTKSNVRNVLKAIEVIDIMPKQVLIEARIMEVSADWLRDVGVSLGTGTTGASGGAGTFGYLDSGRVGGSMLTGVTPSIFGPKATAISGVLPYNAGLEVIFRKLSGEQVEAVFHALEEDVNTNVLSAPRIVTLDGQEAYIMVGTKKPIVESDVKTSEYGVGVGKSFSKYERLGIELNVVPRICGEEYVNMIIYPSITSSTSDVKAESVVATAAGDTTTTDYYPIIDVRETQTQVIIKDRETIAIGGLLKEIKSESLIKVPILGDIPFLGRLFQRNTTDTAKIDLVIFITVKILRPGEVTHPEFSEASSSASEAE